MSKKEKFKASHYVILPELKLDPNKRYLFLVQIGAVFERVTVNEVLLEAAD